MHPNLMELFVNRSVNYPVEVIVSKLRMPRASGPSLEAAYRQLGVHFARLVPRISTLYLAWGSEYDRLLTLMNDFVGGTPFASLDALHMGIKGDHRSLPLIINAPVLRRFEHIGSLSQSAKVSTANLVSFRYQSPPDPVTPSDLLQILSDFHHVEHLTLACHPGRSVAPLDRPAIAFPNLQSLDLECVYLSEIGDLFGHLQIPASANVRMTLRVGPSLNPGPTFERFIGSLIPDCDQLKISGPGFALVPTLTSRGGGRTEIMMLGIQTTDLTFAMFASNPNELTSLELEITPLPPLDALVAALKSCLLLTRLKVSTTETDFENLLQALEHAAEILCPALKSIDCSGTPIRTDRIDQFLKLRRGRGAPLDEFRISQNYAISASS